ncbi:MAG: hypothetical protein D6732_20535 [Methanobacteriota archaeon]|nr:MAG: hypothetical protein D6732_20535 [Euryarchaeota archaeon]
MVHGKVDQDEIDIDASDEIGEIAQAFNEMTNKFREAQVTLVEQQKLQKELQVAQEIQQMLLPSDFPKVEGYDIASYYEAAKEVGGDLFDFVEVDDDTIGICVADVSGKGVPGSMIMTMIRTALRLEARGNKNPAEVLARVNDFVVDDMKRGMFVTMFYVVLDSRNREIHFASAGHNPMILYRNSTKQTYYLNPPGFPVGIQLPDPELFKRTIKSESIRLREDDILVLYTDGVTEAMNRKRELFREERFLDTIRRNAHLSVAEFIKTINKELKEFTGGAPQNDDITVVAIREKMMPSEVIINTQNELKRLIDSGMKVKDALQKLKVSPAHYYRYKNIIESKGIGALKDFLSVMDDTIEKKHLSIEVKTKIFDIVRKHPEFGPKLIAYELRKDEYGNIKVDPDRIYDELVRLRLNTEELRRRWIEKGGTRPLKQPGTPLLTLDGQVILDFESSEQVIAKRRGTTVAPPQELTPSEEEPKKKAIHLVSSEEFEEKETAETAELKTPETPAEQQIQEAVKPEEEEAEGAVEETKAEPTELTTDETLPPESEPSEEQLEAEAEEVASIETVEELETAEPALGTEETGIEEETETIDLEELEEEEVAEESELLPETEKEEDTSRMEEVTDESEAEEAEELIIEKPASEEEEVEPLQTESQKEALEIPPTEEESKEKTTEDEKTKEPAVEEELEAFEIETLVQQEPEEIDLLPELEKMEDPSQILLTPGEEEPVSEGKKLIGNAYSAAELRQIMMDKYKSEKATEFFELVKDDFDQIIQLLTHATNNGQLPQIINKVNILLKIIKTHPMLSNDDMQAIKQFFEEMHNLFSMYKLHLDELQAEEVVRGIKDILNYLENSNIFNSYEQLIESINAVGIMNFQLSRSFKKKRISADNPLSRIKEQLKNKKIISDDAILGPKSD